MTVVFDDLDDICPEEFEELEALSDMYYNEIELTEEEVIVFEEMSEEQRKRLEDIIMNVPDLGDCVDDPDVF